MRALSLHSSALSDAEYSLYTASINDIASIEHDSNLPPIDYDDLNVNVREVRAWLRGRYPTLQITTIDTILKFFAPNLASSDTLTSGQFFAALRLVLHARDGNEVDTALAFVQANPQGAGASTSTSPSTSQRALSPGPTKRASTVTQPRRASLLAERESQTTESHHPHPPPLHPSQRHDIPPPPQSSSHASHPHSPHNPFVIRKNSTSSSSKQHNDDIAKPPLPPRKPPPPPPHISASSTSLPGMFTPPPRHAASQLPPPRPISPAKHPHPLPSAHLISPQYTPNQTSAGVAGGATVTTPFMAGGAAQPSLLLASATLKPVAHVTSTLMKQSLQASKAAQTMKRAEEQLEKERVMQVLKSSSNTASSRNRSSSPTKYPYPTYHHLTQVAPMPPPPPPRSSTSSRTSNSNSDEQRGLHHPPPLPKRRPHPIPSPPISASSLEQVAFATTSTTPSKRQSWFPQSNKMASPFSAPSELATSRRSADHWDDGRGRRDERSTPTTHTMSVSASPPDTRGSPLREGGRPPPLHPDRKPSMWVGYAAAATPLTTTTTTDRNSNSNSSDGEESFEMVYGPSTSSAASSTGAAGESKVKAASVGGRRYPFSPSAPKASMNGGGDDDKNKNNESSPTSRVFRSKSMHYTSSSPASASPFSAGIRVAPPNFRSSTSYSTPTPASGSGGAGVASSTFTTPTGGRRKRPESMQVFMGGSGGREDSPFGTGSQATERGGWAGSILTTSANEQDSSPSRFQHQRYGSLSATFPSAETSSAFMSPFEEGSTDHKTSISSSSSFSGGSGGYGERERTANDSTSTITAAAMTAPTAHAASTTTGASSQLSNFQRTLASFNTISIQPKLDKARYKAEAGLNGKRGFVPRGPVAAMVGREAEAEEKGGLLGGSGSGGSDLMKGFGTRIGGPRALRPELSRGEELDVDRGPRVGEDENSGSDEGVVSDEDGGRRSFERVKWREEERERMLMERDNLKWPAGEGWKPL